MLTLLALSGVVVAGVNGRVVDAVTGAPVPFANLAVLEAGEGTVSDERGTFRLPGLKSDARLTVSAIGYQTRRLSLSELAPDGDIPLIPESRVVRERVTVVADASKRQVLGTVVKKKGFAVGFGSGQLGTQIGARIRVKNPTAILSAHFVVDHTGGERFLYRVNLYPFDDEKLGDNLIPENVIVEAPQRRGPIDVDLARFGIVVSGDVLLCLEWIKADGDSGNQNVMFRGRRRGKSLYMRMTSHAPFQRMRSLGLGFFMIGAEPSASEEP